MKTKRDAGLFTKAARQSPFTKIQCRSVPHRTPADLFSDDSKNSNRPSWWFGPISRQLWSCEAYRDSRQIQNSNKKDIARLEYRPRNLKSPAPIQVARKVTGWKKIYREDSWTGAWSDDNFQSTRWHQKERRQKNKRRQKVGWQCSKPPIKPKLNSIQCAVRSDSQEGSANWRHSRSDNRDGYEGSGFVWPSQGISILKVLC